VSFEIEIKSKTDHGTVKFVDHGESVAIWMDGKRVLIASEDLHRVGCLMFGKCKSKTEGDTC